MIGHTSNHKLSESVKTETRFPAICRSCQSPTDFRTRFSGQDSAQVAFSGRAGHRDDHFTLIFRALGYLDGGPDICARGNACENAFFLGQTTRHRKRIIVCNLNALDNLRTALGVLQVQILWNKSAAQPLNFVRPGFERLSGEGIVK